MPAVRILIVEDEPLIAEDLRGHLDELGYEVCGSCDNALDAMAEIAAQKPDLLLLDINLGDGADGVELAQKVNAKYRVPFIFVTSHSDKATLQRVKAVRPAGFIIKPFDEDDLRTQIEIALARHAAQGDAGTPPGEVQQQGSQASDVLFVRDRGRRVKVPVQEIRYVEADNNYVVVHTAERRYVTACSLTSMAERLPSSSFVRIHRRYLVDVRRITGLSEREAHLGELVLPVGKTHKEELRVRWHRHRPDASRW